MVPATGSQNPETPTGGPNPDTPDTPTGGPNPDTPAIPTTPKGTVLLTHGYGEYSQRYAPFIDVLTARGYDVITYDQRGHGTAPGPRARVDLGTLIEDHLRARRDALRMARTPELFLFGHSMGGLVTAASTLIDHRNLRGTVLTGPALRPLPDLPASLARILLPVARVLPWIPASGLDNSWISRDPEVVRAANEDPVMYHGRVPLLTGATMIVQGEETIRHAARLATPMLILQGGDDHIVSPAGAERFVAGTHDVDIELRIVEHAYHELLNEPEGPELMVDIVNWLDAR